MSGGRNVPNRVSLGAENARLGNHLWQIRWGLRNRASGEGEHHRRGTRQGRGYWLERGGKGRSHRVAGERGAGGSMETGGGGAGNGSLGEMGTEQRCSGPANSWTEPDRHLIFWTVRTGPYRTLKTLDRSGPVRTDLISECTLKHSIRMIFVDSFHKISIPY